MTALHLYPIHNALAIHYHPCAWDGKYALKPMLLDGGKWQAMAETAFVDRARLESIEDGQSIACGELELKLSESKWTIRLKSGLFGTCKASAMEIALEQARKKATGRADGRVPGEGPPSTYESIPIPSETGAEADPSLV